MAQRQSNINPLAVKIDPDLKGRLTKLAETQQRTVHWLMLKAIESYVVAAEEATQLEQETVARWQEAEQGNIVNNNTITAWLQSWGTDNEQERPPCE